jgi:hypothetical protein
MPSFLRPIGVKLTRQGLLTYEPVERRVVHAPVVAELNTLQAA